jgi:hypothetical protein
MKKSELRSLIREQVKSLLKEASYKPADDEFIEDWVREELSKNGKLAIGDAAVEKAIDNIKEEWKEAAARFSTVRGYLMDLRKQGVFDELLESKLTEASTDKYPTEVQSIIDSLIGIGMKKYQLKAHTNYGVWFIELPVTNISINNLVKIQKFLPNFTIGNFPGYWGLSLRTDISVNSK